MSYLFPNKFLAFFCGMAFLIALGVHSCAEAAEASPTAPAAQAAGESAQPTLQPGTAPSGEATGSSGADAPITSGAESAGTLDAEGINRNFDQMLEVGELASENPIGTLLRRMPRYGMSFFKQPASTYAPLTSVPVTAGYVLGPGDELEITLWGMVEESFKVTVNRDGIANVPHVGSVRLAGFTLDEAKKLLKSEFDRYFTGYDINVSMGELRSVTVYVTGDVAHPGAYTVSSFATLVNALLVSGGPSASGSLRRIELKRGGKTITTFDMYDLLLKGDKAKDVRLQPEDVIFVPPVGPLVGLAGELRRPGVYELKGKTRVKDLLWLAGGISAQTFKGRVQYYRVSDNSYRSVFEGDVDGLSEKLLEDGDVLRLFPVVDYSTVVKIEGAVARPGTYGLTPGVTRVSELIAQAGGLLWNASNRAEMTRVTPTAGGPVTRRFEIDLSAALRGDSANDLVLELYDYILVHVVPEWELHRMVSVFGEVGYPGTYAVAKGERLSDLLRRCGGFSSRANVKGALFTRRRVALEQRRELNRVADQMERDLLQAENDQGQSAAEGGFELKNRRELIARLRDIDVLGRVVIKLDVPEAIAGTPWDLELEDGDSLTVPQNPSTVEVMGAVYSASSQVYNPKMGINDYVSAAGGYLRVAHKRMLYLLKADGTVVRLTRNTGMLSNKKWTPPKGFSATVEPGDTIVAPVKYSSRESLEAFRDAIDVIYKVAVAVGVIIN